MSRILMFLIPDFSFIIRGYFGGLFIFASLVDFILFFSSCIAILIFQYLPPTNVDFYQY